MLGVSRRRADATVNTVAGEAPSGVRQIGQGSIKVSGPAVRLTRRSVVHADETRFPRQLSLPHGIQAGYTIRNRKQNRPIGDEDDFSDGGAAARN